MAATAKLFNRDRELNKVGLDTQGQRVLDSLLQKDVVMTVLELETIPTRILSEGLRAYASDGRKAGEGASSGTGVLTFYDGAAWIACDTGATLAD